jgi:4-amino-4-deoxy-L-arabinose transferase-like glycosyltransferase
MSRSQLWFAGLCLGCFLVLLATALPAPFTVDDCNYLGSVAGLRHGSVFLPGTADLPASRALYAFEPLSAGRIPVTPVPSLVPPLYAVLAYPFSLLGWTGLVCLNALACVITLALLFVAARRLTGQERAGWYAATVWLLGASALEYAQGLWPHMLAIALTTSGLLLAIQAADEGSAKRGLAAGALLALAAGLRYQNAVLLGCGLVILVMWGRNRLRIATAFAAGAAPWIALCSLMNHARMGAWHPWSKGTRYTRVAVGDGTSASWDFLLGLWARVVDYSAQPPFPRELGYLRKLPTGDMVTMWGVLKKSWLQASPWVLVALLVLALAWSRRDRFGEQAQRHLRALVVPVAAVLAVFGLAGIYRHDGLTFNQRYFLELGPLVALALAVALVRLPLRWFWLVIGGALGSATALLAAFAFSPMTGYRLQSLAPLILALVSAGLWLAARARPRWSDGACVAIAACVAWSAVLHATTDLRASRLARFYNLGRLTMVEDALTDARPTAIVAALGPSDAFCPLLLDRDAVVVASTKVAAAELPPLLDALVARRRVLLWLEQLPEESAALLAARYQIDMVRAPMLAEIKPRPALPVERR